VRRVSAIPGVQAAAIAEAGPLSNRGGSDRPVESPGHDQGKTPSQAYSDDVGPGFFDAVGVPILAGRDFSPADKPGSPPVGIINQSLARSLFGSQNPIGRSFQLPGNRNVPHPFQIIGVAGDVRCYDLHRPPQPTFYLTFQDGPPYMPTLHVRTRTSDIASMIAAVRKEFDAVDKGFPVFDVKTLETRIDGSLSRERMVAELAAAFGMLALLLAAVGLYGVLAYSVTRRTREIGIRLALGSSAPSAGWLIVREALQLVAMGCSAGILLSIAATRWMSGSLFGVSTADPLTLAASAALILLIAVLAVAVPALRAAHLDPLIALRSD
jgi:predicted permease